MNLLIETMNWFIAAGWLFQYIINVGLFLCLRIYSQSISISPLTEKKLDFKLKVQLYQSAIRLYRLVHKQNGHLETADFLDTIRIEWSFCSIQGICIILFTNDIYVLISPHLYWFVILFYFNSVQKLSTNPSNACWTKLQIKIRW